MGPNQKAFREILSLLVVLEYLAIIVLGIPVGRVTADSFYPEGAVENSLLNFTYALGYDLGTVENTILYNAQNLLGIRTDQLSNITFASLIDNSINYSRVVSERDSIAAPPGSEISLGIYLENGAGHTIGIKNAWLFLGPYGLPQLSDILDSYHTQYRNIAYYRNNVLYTKGGQSIEIGPLGNFVPSSNMESTTYTKVNIIGKISSPIVIKDVHTECVVSQPGEGSVDIRFLVKNVGVLAETVSFNAGAAVELSANEEHLYESRVPLTENSLPTLDITTGHTRCLQKGSIDPISDSADAHALVLARNDEANYYWTASHLNISSSTSTNEFCVTRLPYSMRIQAPICPPLPPYYSLDMPIQQVEVKSGDTTRIPFTITNNGGNETMVRQARVEIPKSWESKVQIFIDNQQVTMGEDLKNSGLHIPALKEKESLFGQIMITGPSLFLESESSEFVVSIATGQEQSSVMVTPYTFSKQSVLYFVGVCRNSNFVMELNVRYEGNRILTEFPLYLRISSPDIKKKTVEVSINGAVSLYNITPNVVAIVSIPGIFTPKDYRIEIKLKGSPEGEKISVIAENIKTAKMLSNCQSEVDKPTVAPTIIVAKDFAPSPLHQVLSAKVDSAVPSILFANQIPSRTLASVFDAGESIKQGVVKKAKYMFLWQNYCNVFFIAIIIFIGLCFVFKPRNKCSK